MFEEPLLYNGVLDPQGVAVIQPELDHLLGAGDSSLHPVRRGINSTRLFKRVVAEVCSTGPPEDIYGQQHPR